MTPKTGQIEPETLKEDALDRCAEGANFLPVRYLNNSLAFSWQFHAFSCSLVGLI